MSDGPAAFLERSIDLAPLQVAEGSAVAARAEDRQGGVLPAEIQYMPPGRHQIRAHQGGKPVSVEVEVTAGTAEALQRSLEAAFQEVEARSGDRPFFDFNHEDREAAGWPMSFRWAGDDPANGGVRARVDWSDAGRKAIEGRTFRRFSPSFFVTDRKVTGAPVNMGGLVNRAAFRSIQPLFARGEDAGTENPFQSSLPMPNLISELQRLGLVEASTADETTAVRQTCTVIAKLREDLDSAHARITELESEKAAGIRARAQTHVEGAIQAGRIQPADAKAREFWVAALIADEPGALHALSALPAHSVLHPVTSAAGEGARPRDLMDAQQRKLAEVRAANPDADFDTVFAKAQADAPELFR